MSDQLPNETIIRRITKLLALATNKGATEHEALVAASKVQELLQEYGLSMAEIEASGGKSADDGKRERATVKRSSMYKWQRDLMETLAETNFCMHMIHEEFDETTGRRAKRHQLIGRTVNVVATQMMYDYLISTMKRLVSEAGYAPGTHGEKDYHFWLEGCSERLRLRVKDRADEVKRASEKKAREARAAASHPSAAGGTTKNALVLAEVYINEEELNRDLLYGLEPGTTTRERLEREERSRRRTHAFEKLKAEGIDEDVAWYMANGYSREQSEGYVAANRKNAEEQAKIAAKRKSRASSGPRYRAWTKADHREAEKRASSSYQAGRSAGENIGLDPQVKHEQKKRIG